jgi:hypothetical protein
MLFQKITTFSWIKSGAKYSKVVTGFWYYSTENVHTDLYVQITKIYHKNVTSRAGSTPHHVCNQGINAYIISIPLACLVYLSRSNSAKLGHCGRVPGKSEEICLHLPA